ncbi:MAG: hypothetical protein IPN83_18645 [Holophagales bacterium]|nr:hypothetical protein [Holophagales bacterium]
MSPSTARATPSGSGATTVAVAGTSPPAVRRRTRASREKIASFSFVGRRSPPEERFVRASAASSSSDSNSTVNA